MLLVIQTLFINKYIYTLRNISKLCFFAIDWNEGMAFEENAFL